MSPHNLQSLCDLGQQALVRMDYLTAQSHLVQAEHAAWELHDFDTLSRLYMPLQEARRQIRQRCGEGTVCRIIAASPDQTLNSEQIISQYPTGQLLVAGHNSLAPARAIRRLAREKNLYLECFLATVQGDSLLVYPLDPQTHSPSQPIPIDPASFPAGPIPGNTQTYAQVMSLWENLHLPYLQAAELEQDLLAKAHGYRRAIEVDYACELAHQHLSDVARQLARHRRST